MDVDKLKEVINRLENLEELTLRGKVAMKFFEIDVTKLSHLKRFTLDISRLYRVNATIKGGEGLERVSMVDTVTEREIEENEPGCTLSTLVAFIFAPNIKHLHLSHIYWPKFQQDHSSWLCDRLESLTLSGSILGSGWFTTWPSNITLLRLQGCLFGPSTRYSRATMWKDVSFNFSNLPKPLLSLIIEELPSYNSHIYSPTRDDYIMPTDSIVRETLENEEDDRKLFAQKFATNDEYNEDLDDESSPSYGYWPPDIKPRDWNAILNRENGEVEEDLIEDDDFPFSSNPLPSWNSHFFLCPLFCNNMPLPCQNIEVIVLKQHKFAFFSPNAFHLLPPSLKVLKANVDANEKPSDEAIIEGAAREWTELELSTLPALSPSDIVSQHHHQQQNSFFWKTNPVSRNPDEEEDFTIFRSTPGILDFNRFMYQSAISRWKSIGGEKAVKQGLDNVVESKVDVGGGWIFSSPIPPSVKLLSVIDIAPKPSGSTLADERSKLKRTMREEGEIMGIRIGNGLSRQDEYSRLCSSSPAFSRFFSINLIDWESIGKSLRALKIQNAKTFSTRILRLLPNLKALHVIANLSPKDRVEIGEAKELEEVVWDSQDSSLTLLPEKLLNGHHPTSQRSKVDFFSSPRATSSAAREADMKRKLKRLVFTNTISDRLLSTIKEEFPQLEEMHLLKCSLNDGVTAPVFASSAAQRKEQLSYIQCLISLLKESSKTLMEYKKDNEWEGEEAMMLPVKGSAKREMMGPRQFPGFSPLFPWMLFLTPCPSCFIFTGHSWLSQSPLPHPLSIDLHLIASSSKNFFFGPNGSLDRIVFGPNLSDWIIPDSVHTLRLVEDLSDLIQRLKDDNIKKSPPQPSSSSSSSLSPSPIWTYFSDNAISINLTTLKLPSSLTHLALTAIDCSNIKNLFSLLPLSLRVLHVFNQTLGTFQTDSSSPEANLSPSKMPQCLEDVYAPNLLLVSPELGPLSSWASPVLWRLVCRGNYPNDYDIPETLQVFRLEAKSVRTSRKHSSIAKMRSEEHRLLRNEDAVPPEPKRQATTLDEST